MKSGITVAEAKQAKQHLEEDLLNRIRGFERETGCSVNGIKLVCNQATGCPSEIHSLSVGCIL